MRESKVTRGFGLVIVTAWVATTVASEVAVDLNPAEMTVWGDALANTNHGWEFTVNSPIEVTHIGLLDIANPPNSMPDTTPDGFSLAYPVGLFNAGGTLLTSGTMSPGTGDMLVDNFRYVPVPTVTLSPGVHYVVAFHTATHNWPDVDYHIANIPQFQPNPAINYVIARWGIGSGLALPPNLVDPNGAAPYRFGPNFLFVPEPGNFTALALAGLALFRLRSWRVRNDRASSPRTGNDVSGGGMMLLRHSHA